MLTLQNNFAKYLRQLIDFLAINTRGFDFIQMHTYLLRVTSPALSEMILSINVRPFTVSLSAPSTSLVAHPLLINRPNPQRYQEHGKKRRTLIFQKGHEYKETPLKEEYKRRGVYYTPRVSCASRNNARAGNFLPHFRFRSPAPPTP